jgi:hypothetical protein
MNTQAFERLTRRAAATVSRRASLLTLGGAAVAAATPGITKAGKKSQSCGGKLKKRCTQNKTQCIAPLTDICNGSADCIATLSPCCDECFSGGFVACLAAIEA